jgi:hypothetical protein
MYQYFLTGFMMGSTCSMDGKTRIACRTLVGKLLGKWSVRKPWEK